MFRSLIGLFVLCLSVASAAKGPVVPTRESVLPKPGAEAHIDATAKEMEVTLAIGFGYHLCRNFEKLPSLETAYLCPGLAPGLENFLISLAPVKTSKPDYKMWSGPVKFSLGPVNGVVMGYELLVSYAVLDEKVYLFIDGRVMNSVTKEPSYFRITSYNAVDQLDSTYHYGTPFEFKAKTGEKLLMSPVISISSYNERAGKPKRPKTSTAVPSFVHPSL